MSPFSGNARFPLEQRVVEAAPAPPDSHVPWWLNPVVVLLVLCIEAYRRLWPNHLKRRCIYSPSCSLYGLRSLKRHGLWRGVARTGSRLGRCNGALYRGGEDLP